MSPAELFCEVLLLLPPVWVEGGAEVEDEREVGEETILLPDWVEEESGDGGEGPGREGEEEDAGPELLSSISVPVPQGTSSPFG